MNARIFIIILWMPGWLTLAWLLARYESSAGDKHGT